MLKNIFKKKNPPMAVRKSEEQKSLLPCPFCGEKPGIRFMCLSTAGVKVWCEKCKLKKSLFAEDEIYHVDEINKLWNDAIDKWNERH